MRVIFTSSAGYGHLHPKVPLARALAGAGHDVAFAIPERFCDRVRDAGFTAFPVGPDGSALAELVAGTGVPTGGGVVHEDHFRFAFTRILEVAVPAVMADLMPLVERWVPTLLVHDTSDWAAPLVAAATGTVAVNQGWGPLFPTGELAAAGEAVAAFWDDRGLERRPLGGMFDGLYLDLCPPSLQVPHATEVVRTRKPLRPIPFDAVGGEGLPAWVDELDDRPLVYVTLGTWFNLEIGVFATVLQALRHEPLNVVVTVGHANDPASFGPQPGNVRIEGYIPMSLLLPRCHAVVAHGGAGSMLAALSRGIPMLLLPQGADQFNNADRCVAAGAGRRLLPAELGTGAVRAEMRALLGDPGYGRAAGAIAEEIGAMPSPDEVAAVLERLATAATRSSDDGH